MTDNTIPSTIMYLLALPDDVLEKILSYVSYDEISRSRLVCQRFNEVSKRALNHGFHKVEKYHSKCLKLVKSKLPRRESERRNHALARHCDILTAMETRISLLSMTFKKYIDSNACCFIPGKVLDEVYRVLRYVTSVQSPVRTHEVLQELRDLSSMAMEYFEEKIAPGLNKYKDTVPRIIVCSSPKQIRPNTPALQVQKMARFVGELSKRNNNLLSEISTLRTKIRDIDSIGKRVADLEKLVSESKKRSDESDKLVADQQITISQQAVQLFEQELKIEKLSKMLKEKQNVGNSSKSVKTLRTSSRRKQKCKCAKKTTAPQKNSKRKLVADSDDKKIENEVKKLKI